MSARELHVITRELHVITHDSSKIFLWFTWDLQMVFHDLLMRARELHVITRDLPEILCDLSEIAQARFFLTLLNAF